MERVRPGGRWILIGPLGDKQIGESVELNDTDLQHQRHGLVIRGDEAARAVRTDEVDHDAVVDVDRNLATRLCVDTPVGPINREGEAVVDVNGQLERHKEWRAVVQESYAERCPDCPMQGQPRSREPGCPASTRTEKGREQGQHEQNIQVLEARAL